MDIHLVLNQDQEIVQHILLIAMLLIKSLISPILIQKLINRLVFQISALPSINNSCSCFQIIWLIMSSHQMINIIIHLTIGICFSVSVNPIFLVTQLWIVDSGVTKHICCCISEYEAYTKFFYYFAKSHSNIYKFQWRYYAASNDNFQRYPIRPSIQV